MSEVLGKHQRLHDQGEEHVVQPQATDPPRLRECLRWLWRWHATGTIIKDLKVVESETPRCLHWGDPPIVGPGHPKGTGR